MTDDQLTQLERLHALRERGVLSEDEFAREKARVLGRSEQPDTAVAPERRSRAPLILGALAALLGGGALAAWVIAPLSGGEHSTNTTATHGIGRKPGTPVTDDFNSNAPLPLPTAPPPPPPVAGPPPAAVTAQFYRWYVGALSQSADPQATATFRNLVTTDAQATARRLQTADQMDADYFLRAQDTGDDWRDNVTVRPLAGGDRPQMLVTLGQPGPQQWRLRVTLAEEDGRWKIDRVTDANP